ncbi:DMT family transporter, partial [Sandarakinorhabdus sp.]|uniref:DMT family transporter n=1 Tax=Sandarakinorhabdus sp. TaxID=1916663 RepID=UPI0035626663
LLGGSRGSERAKGVRAPAFAGAAGRIIALAVLAGAAFAADLSVWHLGILRTTLANATLLANGATFLLPLYGLVILKQRLTGPQWWALACAAAGVALLLGRSAELSPRHLAGDLLCLAAALFYTVYLVAIEKVRGTLEAFPALALATLASAIALAPLAASGALGGIFWPHDWTPIVGLAIGSQVIGQGLIVYAVRHLSPLVVGLTLLVQPAISAIIGAWRFGEVPGPLELLGALMVVAALLIARLPSRA